MQEDPAAVGDLVDKMDGGPGVLYAAGKGRLMDAEPVKALPAEGGDQRGVDVQNPLGPAAGEALAEDAEKARQDDELDPPRLQRSLERLLKALLPAAA